MKKSLGITAAVVFVINFLLFTCTGVVPVQTPQIQFVESAPDHQTTYQAHYTSLVGEVEADDIQVPIPLKDRVFNMTGTQCVWVSLETLGRWAEEPKLINPPLSSLSSCRSYANPSDVDRVLTRLGVKYEQVSGSMSQAVALMKKGTKAGRGCLFTIPGHAMTMVHFDEEKDECKWIDNVDRSLKIQTAKISKFKQHWDTWVTVIYPDNDEKFNLKTNKIALPRLLPIIDRNNPQGNYPKDYILMPQSVVPR